MTDAIVDAPSDLSDGAQDAQTAIREGDVVRLTHVDEDAGEFTMRLLVEGQETIDGRYFTPDAVEWRDLPLPLMYLTENRGEGHKGSKVAGSITDLWRENAEVWGRGHFSSTEEGQEARRLIAEGVLNGVSADVGGAAFEFEADSDGKKKQRIDSGTVMGATVLPLQAFAEARIAVTAGGYPVDPPTTWFTDPSLTGPTAMTVTDDGHVFGHLATWDTCHVGIQGRCQTAPRSATGYAYFAHGVTKTVEGNQIKTGRITLGTGHAALSLGADATKSHYDDTGTAIADIAVGEDRHGIWFAGALRPDTTPEQVRILRASAVSGDWRSMQGNLELMALLAVNTPGFPVPRLATLAASAAGGDFSEDEPVALISASILQPVVADGCGCGGKGGGKIGSAEDGEFAAKKKPAMMEEDAMMMQEGDAASDTDDTEEETSEDAMVTKKKLQKKEVQKMELAVMRGKVNKKWAKGAC
jgi:hypothetical protein